MMTYPEDEDLYEKRASPAGCLLIVAIIGCVALLLIYVVVKILMNLFL